MNNKLHDIEDININIEAFAAEPLPENTSLNIYREQMYSRYLILKTYHFDEQQNKGEINGDMLREIYDLINSRERDEER